MCYNPSIDKKSGATKPSPPWLVYEGGKLTAVSSMMERKKERKQKEERTPVVEHQHIKLSVVVNNHIVCWGSRKQQSLCVWNMLSHSHLERKVFSIGNSLLTLLTYWHWNSVDFNNHTVCWGSGKLHADPQRMLLGYGLSLTPWTFSMGRAYWHCLLAELLGSVGRVSAYRAECCGFKTCRSSYHLSNISCFLSIYNSF